MWQQQPDYVRYKEKPNGEGWLLSRQEGILMQIKPAAPSQHAQFILVSYYRLSARIGKPIRQQRMLRHLGIERWINLQKIGWQRCTPPSQVIRLIDGAAITNRIDRVERSSTGIY